MKRRAKTMMVREKEFWKKRKLNLNSSFKDLSGPHRREMVAAADGGTLETSVREREKEKVKTGRVKLIDGALEQRFLCANM